MSGLAFGAAAAGAGLSAWQACALSALAFTGASQFALIGAVAVGGSLAAATAGAILLGSRNTLYGLRLAGLLRLRGARRVIGALGVIDETTAVTLAQPDPRSSRAGFAATFCCLYLTWNLATLAGALGASTLALAALARAGRGRAGRVPGPDLAAAAGRAAPSGRSARPGRSSGWA